MELIWVFHLPLQSNCISAIAWQVFQSLGGWGGTILFCEVDSKNVFPVYMWASGTTPEHGTCITVMAFSCVARTVDLYGNVEDILFTHFDSLIIIGAMTQSFPSGGMPGRLGG